LFKLTGGTWENKFNHDKTANSTDIRTEYLINTGHDYPWINPFSRPLQHRLNHQLNHVVISVTYLMAKQSIYPYHQDHAKVHQHEDFPREPSHKLTVAIHVEF